MKKLFGFALILGIVLSFIGCKVSTKNDTSESAVKEDLITEKYANEYLEIIVKKGADRAAYYEASEIDHFNLVVDFADASIEDLNVNFGPNDTYSFNIFKDCTVALKVSGFDSSSNRIAYGSKNVSFTVGNDVSVTVAVDMFTKGSTVTIGVEINEPGTGEQGIDIYKNFYNYPDGKQNASGTLTLKNNGGFPVLCFTDTVDPKNYIGTVPSTGEITVKLPEGSFYNIVAVAKSSYEESQTLAKQTSKLTYYSNTQAYTIDVAADNLVGGATWIFNNGTSYWVSIENVDGSGERFAVIKPNAQRVSIPVAKNTSYDYKIVYLKELKYKGKIMGIAEKTAMAENDTASFYNLDTMTADITGKNLTTSDDDLAPTVQFINNSGKTVRVYNGQIQLCDYGISADDYSCSDGVTALFADSFTTNSNTSTIGVRSVAWNGIETCTVDKKMEAGKVYIITLASSSGSASDPTTGNSPVEWNVTVNNATSFYDQ